MCGRMTRITDKNFAVTAARIVHHPACCHNIGTLKPGISIAWSGGDRRVTPKSSVAEPARGAVQPGQTDHGFHRARIHLQRAFK